MTTRKPNLDALSVSTPCWEGAMVARLGVRLTMRDAVQLPDAQHLFNAEVQPGTP